ncbi:MAG: RNA polymerase sigma factor [SAR86 cluster bacterium]|uniref:RNA polymerase sigma factor n=1 Tax=SAR86 cluster bacterium TaxID=2030880 RepID=A0A2A4MKR5_9GAMM|nr:MAG: RNA polymerase sigma factor [SAR86 cluster bacterium]
MLDNLDNLDRFLEQVQARAYRMARIATGNSDDALDIVQDAMFKLVEKYSDRAENEWYPLFYRILQSRIYDRYRREGVRSKFFKWLSATDAEAEDPIQTAVDKSAKSPEQELQINQGMDKLQKMLGLLPIRQQQAFLLRAWEGMSVKETASIMCCAQGSVKTHYSRAVHTLRDRLGEACR